MFCFILLFFVCNNHLQIVASSDINLEDEFNSFYEKTLYKGEKFHTAYLMPDKVQPTVTDLTFYLKSVNLVVDYFNNSPNVTDCNTGLGMFFTKALLKKTLIDDGIKLKRIGLYTQVKETISKAENIVSHFIYSNREYDWEDIPFKLSEILKSDEAQVYSVKSFSRNTMKKWIYSNIKLNDFIVEMDEATYPKEKYAETVTMDKYLNVDESDECIARISYIPGRVDMDFHPCRPDPFCLKFLLAPKSAAYSLSHRLLNILGRQQIKRCFIVSPRVDDMHIELLCSNMYREVVYLARRGYFSRDLFLEHIALCGLLGYEEFHRRHWFHKAASWINKDGCIHENYNFEINRTQIHVDAETNPKKVMELKRLNQKLLADKCHRHPMILLIVVLAHGIRHAAHFITN